MQAISSPVEILQLYTDDIRTANYVSSFTVTSLLPLYFWHSSFPRYSTEMGDRSAAYRLYVTG